MRAVVRMHPKGCPPLREIPRLHGSGPIAISDIMSGEPGLGFPWPVSAEIRDVELELNGSSQRLATCQMSRALTCLLAKPSDWTT